MKIAEKSFIFWKVNGFLVFGGYYSLNEVSYSWTSSKIPYGTQTSEYLIVTIAGLDRGSQIFKLKNLPTTKLLTKNVVWNDNGILKIVT